MIVQNNINVKISNKKELFEIEKILKRFEFKNTFYESTRNKGVYQSIWIDIKNKEYYESYFNFGADNCYKYSNDLCKNLHNILSKLSLDFKYQAFQKSIEEHINNKLINDFIFIKDKLSCYKHYKFNELSYNVYDNLKDLLINDKKFFYELMFDNTYSYITGITVINTNFIYKINDMYLYYTGDKAETRLFFKGQVITNL